MRQPIPELARSLAPLLVHFESQKLFSIFFFFLSPLWVANPILPAPSYRIRRHGMAWHGIDRGDDHRPRVLLRARRIWAWPRLDFNRVNVFGTPRPKRAHSGPNPPI